MNKRIRKKLAKRGRYKKYSNYAKPWTKEQVLAFAEALNSFNEVFRDIAFTPASQKTAKITTSLPDIYWREVSNHVSCAIAFGRSTLKINEDGTVKHIPPDL